LASFSDDSRALFCLFASLTLLTDQADEVDICILEEPEHLNWYRAPGENWTTKFKHVVGIIHTNYFFYATEQPAAFVRAPAMRLLCSWMCRAHCHRVIKLSGTLGKFAPEKELVENVHGVRGTFLEIGEDVRQILASKKAQDHPVFAPDASPTVYFIGKMLWSKGLGSLMELLKYAEESADLRLHVDMYGGGPDKDAAEMKSKKLGVDLEFHGPVDHAKLALSHKVFVNPSTSEVLCTTVAEALAMGKFVVLPSHPSNDFFAQFPNCLPYTNKEEFVGNLYYALTHSPAPLTKEYAHALSWAAATERLEAAGSISVEEAERMAEVMESRELGVEVSPSFALTILVRFLMSPSTASHPCFLSLVSD
jgi:digalactosyldiacylglycerol synthase